MTTLRKKIGRNGFHILLFSLLIPGFSSRAQTATSSEKRPASDVVLVALSALDDPREEHRRHVRKALIGSSDEALDLEKRLLEMQMNIVRETAKFGPVLLLAPDETTKSAVYQRCKEFQICELFRSDQIRMKVVPHDGVWIRDFGPQIDAVGDSAHVVHWRYFDNRAEESRREKLQELAMARLKLLEIRIRQDQTDDFSAESSAEDLKASDSVIDEKITLLREFSQILGDTSLQRFSDENSAFDIADAVLITPDFEYKSSSVSLDGGNLLKLEDGRCLTTRVLLSRNKDQNTNLDQELVKTGGCRNVTFLDPLPGPVIEHVDMFALPAGGKRILLPSYDLSNPFAEKYWGKMSNAERYLALNAELAMDLNAERLKSLGYEVVRVDSPFPRIPANGDPYYPTVLNALVRAGADGSRQVLIPVYQDYEADIQASAKDQVAAAFGPKAEIVSIEATAAAMAQGAVHCLTLTAPLRLSIFHNSGDAARRSAYLARKAELDRKIVIEIASQIPATGLQGSWVILEENEQWNAGLLELYPRRIFFGTEAFEKGVYDQLETKGTYTIEKKDLASWAIHLQFPDQDGIPAIVQWLSNDQAKLVLNDGDATLILRRFDSELVSPFKPEEIVAQQTTATTAAPVRKHAKRRKPTTPTGRAAGSAEPSHP